MAKAIITAAEHGTLNETLKAEYRAGTAGEKLEGKFVLKVDEVDGFALENVVGLKNSVSSARQERDEARDQLKAYRLDDGTPMDASAAKDAMKKAKDRDGWTPEQKVQERIDAEKNAVKAKYEGELKTAREELTSRDREIDELLVDSNFSAAIAAHGGKPGAGKALTPYGKQHVKVVRENGKPIAVILGPDGKTPLLTKKQGSTDRMGIDEWVGEVLKKDETFSALFSGTPASGVGAGGKDKDKSRKPTGGMPQAGGGAGGSGGDVEGGTFGGSFVDQLKIDRRAEAGASA